MAAINKAIGTLSAIPFHDVIAGPLNACIEAQSQAALSTVNFIEKVGLQPADENGNVSAHYIHFSFYQHGRKINLSVPLLTIVPIPYISISTIDISFKAKVTGIETSSDTEETSDENIVESTEKKKKGLGIIIPRKTSEIKTTISSKKDSKSMQESSYSIESTIDVNIHATQESMPGGMAKILEMLNAAVDICNPDGELNISENNLVLAEGEKAYITIAYKDGQGILKPEEVMVNGVSKDSLKVNNGNLILMLEGTGSKKEYIVKVGNNPKFEKGETITVSPM